MMTLYSLTIFTLVVALAAANGANDVSKGVATLAGSGVTRYGRAILWGALTTLAGALLSTLLSARMLKLFTSGIVAAEPTPTFTLAVVSGAAGWIALATVLRLPVSTTHAIIGSLIGAGMLHAAASIQWASAVPRLVLPLLLSVAVSYALSAWLNRICARRLEAAKTCVCVGVETLDAGALQQPYLHVFSDENCSAAQGYIRFNGEALHWLSSGAVSFARGLNDTPKFVAIGAAVGGFHLSMDVLLLLVAAAMFAGSLYAGQRVAPVLAEKVIQMDHREGMLANVATALLVGVGANWGLPMSTTHVSAGAIAGIAGPRPERLDRRTLADLAMAWTVTPLFAALVAMATYALVSL